MTFQEVPDQPKKGIWKPNKDDNHREGKYLRLDPPKEGKEKFGSTCILKVPEGELKLPNHETLTSKMQKVPIGAYVKIDYIGKGDDGKTFLYKVAFDSDYVPQATLGNQPDVGAPSDAAGKLMASVIAVVPAGAGMSDDTFWGNAKEFAGGLSAAVALVDKLKKEGRITQINGLWKAT